MNFNSAALVRITIGVILSFIFLGISYIGVQEELPFLVLIGIVLSLLSVIVWYKKSFLSYRFLFPGMMCFLIFTIFPIFFSVLISFTNLGTGHFFSKEEATKTLLQNSYLPENPESLNFQLFVSDNQYFLNSDSYIAQFRLDQKEAVHLIALGENSKTQSLTILPLKEVYKLSPKLKALTFVLPNQRELSYHRTDLLIEKKALYKIHPKTGHLENQQTGETYIANHDTGFYVEKDSKKKILPGFYTFVGVNNYLNVFTNPNFKKTFLKVSTWTFIWALVGVALSFSLGISLAIFLNDKNLKGKAIYRNLLILPYSIPFFISVLVFKGMFSKDFGIINETLKYLTLSPVPWLENAFWAKISCLLVNLWLGFPYMFLVTTGILQSIPESVYEAAKIDGANRWHRFRHITFPMVLNAITPLLIGSFAFNLGNFVGIYLLTGGGPAMDGATTPAGETDILISYTYRLAFEGAGGQLFGMASSIALFIFVIITILTVINFKLFNVNPDSSNKKETV